MYSISKLCKEYNLSRSTLLYYDRIGLLNPKERTGANYRNYSEEDRIRLGKICAFREAGVPLDQIKELLDTGEVNENLVLERRLYELNEEIRYLRLQQKIIIEMFKAKNINDKAMLMDKKTFISILKSAGLKDETFSQLHIQFEKNSPEAHQFFLEFIGIPEDEIKQIRMYSKKDEKNP